LAGAAIDHSSSAFGFASVGLVGTVGVLVAMATIALRRVRQPLAVPLLPATELVANAASGE
jgi:hypothetical protein